MIKLWAGLSEERVDLLSLTCQDQRGDVRGKVGRDLINALPRVCRAWGVVFFFKTEQAVYTIDVVLTNGDKKAVLRQKKEKKQTLVQNGREHRWATPRTPGGGSFLFFPQDARHFLAAWPLVALKFFGHEKLRAFRGENAVVGTFSGGQFSTLSSLLRAAFPLRALPGELIRQRKPIGARARRPAKNFAKLSNAFQMSFSGI